MRNNMVKVFWIHERNFIQTGAITIPCAHWLVTASTLKFHFFFSNTVAQLTSENRALKTQRKKLLEEVKAGKVTKREIVSSGRMPEGRHSI